MCSSAMVPRCPQLLISTFCCLLSASSLKLAYAEAKSLHSGLVPVQRELLQDQASACPLTFTVSDLDRAARQCSATGMPLCCENVNVAVMKARARYVNATRSIYLLQAQADPCIAMLQAGLDAQKIGGGASSVLKMCNVSSSDFAMRNIAAFDAKSCSNFDVISNFTSTNQAIRRACYSNYNANSTAGLPCSRTCIFPASVTDGLTWELSRGYGGTISFLNCVDSVLLVIAATAPSPSALESMGSCLWNPAESATCTSMDWDIVSFDPVANACQPCIQQSPECSSPADDASKTCCNAVMGTAALVWTNYTMTHGGNIFTPPIEALACYDKFGDQLEKHGVGRHILTKLCGIARDTLSTTHTGCQGLLTVDEMATETNQFESLKPACDPDTCSQSTCFADYYSTALQLTSKPGPSSTFVGCVESVMVAFLAKQPNQTALASAASCALGLNNASRLAYAANNGQADLLSPIQSSSSSSSPNYGAIVGGVLGGLAVLLAVVGFVFLARRKEKGAEFFSTDEAKGFYVPRSGSLSGSDAPKKVTLRDLLPKQSEPDSVVRVFSLRELQEATHDFSKKQLLGQGGAGEVFKGRLQDGQVVAIKMISARFGSLPQLENEAQILCRLAHRNVVSLLGWCSEDGVFALVFPFLPNGSLQQQLEKEDSVLSWPTRIRIALGTAVGLEYLHSKTIIHRDVKSSNVLLDHEFTAKVSDCGISREGPDEGMTHISTGVKGTVGYLDPEYYFYHQLTEKSDCFSFGVVLLEIITGKRPIDLRRAADQHNLLLWAKPLLEQDCVIELLDERLMGKVDPASLKLVADIASGCLHDNSRQRPSMTQIKEKLEYSLHVALESVDLQRRKEELESKRQAGATATSTMGSQGYGATWTNGVADNAEAELSLGSTFGDILSSTQESDVTSNSSKELLR